MPKTAALSSVSPDSVQVSRTPAFRATRRWLSVASERRQGTKSREVRQVGAASPYGDCAFAVLEGMSGSGIWTVTWQRIGRSLKSARC
jgi:hypothetical protein